MLLRKMTVFLLTYYKRRKSEVWGLRGRREQKFSVLWASVVEGCPLLGPSSVEHLWQLPSRFDIIL